MSSTVQFEIKRLSNLISAYKERHDLSTAEYHARSLYQHITASKLREKAAIAMKINTFCHNALGMAMATAIITMGMAVTDISPLTNTIAFFASIVVSGILTTGTVITLNRLALYIKSTFEEYDDKADIFIEEALSPTLSRHGTN